MSKLVEIPKDPSILVSSRILSYEKPDSIYIPVEIGAKILVKKGEKVKIGTPVYKTETKIMTSSLSGVVGEVKMMDTIQGKIYSLEIINDFREQKVIEPVMKRNINNIKKEVLDKLLAIHFQVDFNGKENLVLNSLDDEPYILTENFYLNVYYEEFLELLDKLAKLYGFKRLEICVKSNSSENINKLMEYLGMYPNIKLNIMPDLYLLGKEEMLLNHLELDKDKTLVITASMLYHVYNLIKRNRQITDKLITISGNGLKNPSVVKVKIGAKLASVIDGLIDIREGEVFYVADGLLGGKIVDIENFVVSNELKGLLIMKKGEDKREGKCLNCGECISICPVGLNPKLFLNKKYLEKAQKKCLKCGLCSYICPVYINFNKYLEGEAYE